MYEEELVTITKPSEYNPEKFEFKVDVKKTTLGELLEKAGLKDRRGIHLSYEGKLIYKKTGMMLGMSQNQNEDLNMTLHELFSGGTTKEFTFMMTRMMFPTSGKMGFQNFIDNDLKGNIFDKELMIKMYHRENELRLSDTIQEKMDNCEIREYDGYVKILDEIQKTVLKENGFEGNCDELKIYRQGIGYYKDDPQVISIPLYSKYNRAKEGNIGEGDDLIDVLLTNPETPNSQISLSSFYQKTISQKNLPQNTPMVVIAGSIT